MKYSHWEPAYILIGLDRDPYFGPEIIGNNFYISAALCPRCTRPMFKTVFPVGREYQVLTTLKIDHIKRVFTCPFCKAFYAAPPGRRITDGFVYLLECLNENDYKRWFADMDRRGSMIGRQDL